MKLSDLIVQHKNWLENQEAGDQIDLKTITLDTEQITNAVLEGAIFEQVTFQELEFFSCDFTGCSFFDCIFSSCQFIHCSFHKAEFHNCQFERVKISKCSFTKTEWYHGNLQQARFVNCDLSWSYLESIDLRYGQLSDINLEGVFWHNTKVYGACFKGIHFGNMHPARIQGTDISQDGDGSADIDLQRFREIFECDRC